ncbi:MAG: hypothetical protein CVT99_10945 [Bacteroidetes bacterium HGW-Bacteroidetes-16]|nr:MAG: hypothetical protein CVT99_10945 [Bacteroidetes bacterium HGW-Bacteroidetes-16]
MRIGTRMKHGKWNADDSVRTGQARVGRIGHGWKRSWLFEGEIFGLLWDTPPRPSPRGRELLRVDNLYFT